MIRVNNAIMEGVRMTNIHTLDRCIGLCGALTATCRRVSRH